MSPKLRPRGLSAIGLAMKHQLRSLREVAQVNFCAGFVTPKPFGTQEPWTGSVHRDTVVIIIAHKQETHGWTTTRTSAPKPPLRSARLSALETWVATRIPPRIARPREMSPFPCLIRDRPAADEQGLDSEFRMKLRCHSDHSELYPGLSLGSRIHDTRVCHSRPHAV